MTDPRPYLAEWSPEQDEELAKLWSSRDLSCSAIGAILGCGKNAVLGRAWRLKLPPKGQPIKINWSGKKRKPRRDIGMPRDRYRQRIINPKPVENDVPRPEPIPEFVASDTDLAALAGPAFEPLAGTEPVSLVELTTSSCRWPVDIESRIAFCGCQRVEGSVYCSTHKTRAVGTGTASERAADNLKRGARPAVRGMLAAEWA